MYIYVYNLSVFRRIYPQITLKVIQSFNFGSTFHIISAVPLVSKPVVFP